MPARKPIVRQRSNRPTNLTSIIVGRAQRHRAQVNDTISPVARKLGQLDKNLQSLNTKIRSFLLYYNGKIAPQIDILEQIKSVLEDEKFLDIMFGEFQHLNEYLMFAKQMEDSLVGVAENLSENLTNTGNGIDNLRFVAEQNLNYINQRGTSQQKMAARLIYQQIQTNFVNAVVGIEEIQGKLTGFVADVNELFLHIANNGEVYEKVLNELDDPKYNPNLREWAKDKLKENCRSTQANQRSTTDKLAELLEGISLEARAPKLPQGSQALQGF